jgi:hypothetical protein
MQEIGARQNPATNLDNQVPENYGEVVINLYVVGVRGLEPPTSASRTLRASQLRHTPLITGVIIPELEF